MVVGQLGGPEVCPVKSREQPVQHREGQKTVPTQRACVRMRNRPVGVVGKRIDTLDGQGRAFQRGHAVGRHRHHHELQHRVLAHLVPRAAQGQQAVQHAAPRWRDEHEREHHAERLRPIRQRGVEQVMRSRPDVDENQTPEMDDGQPVAEHGPVGRLGEKIIHQAEIRRGQEERDGVVRVPPLHQAVLYAGIHRITLQPAPRHFHRIDDVEHGDGDDRGDVKPDGHVHVFLTAPGDGAEQVDRERHPDDRDGDVNRPFQLRVFLAGRVTERQGEGRGDDDELPTPEIERAQKIAEHPRLAQPLERIINAGEHPVADEREYHRVGVQRPDPAERDELQVQVRVRKKQLHGGEQAHGHADDAPDDGRNRKRADDPVVIFERFYVGIHWFGVFVFEIGAGRASPGSSARMRKDGVQVSSYWPLRTAQMKAPRNVRATPRLARMRMMITLMRPPSI